MTTFIDTNQCRRINLAHAQGEVAEIVNRELCGAEDIVAMLRWLGPGEHVDADVFADKLQLIYLMEGDAVIGLNGQDYDVGKGKGIYLDPNETARINQRGDAQLKLLHVIVEKSPA